MNCIAERYTVKHTVHVNEWLSFPYSCALFKQINQAFYTMSSSADSMTNSIDVVEGWYGASFLNIGRIANYKI